MKLAAHCSACGWPQLVELEDLQRPFDGTPAENPWRCVLCRRNAGFELRPVRVAA